MKSWHIDVLLEKATAEHNCEKCKIKTIWYLTIVLDTKTNTKYLEWWCSFCESKIYEDIGPYIPN